VIKTARTATLEIAYRESGPPDGTPTILLHGWPSDVHDWDAVADALAAAGWRTIVPWLRGFGPTRFLDAQTPRSGQQAALGSDLHDLLDALALERAFLAGYDWGGRAACIVAARWPERVRGLVTVTGYNIQNVARSGEPRDPRLEHRLWYQWYFHSERGRAGLTQNRGALARLLWELWSPNWAFDDALFARTAPSFDNPDFVDVTIHSYRHRYGMVPGDPVLEPLEAFLSAQPPIAVPTVVLHGEADGVGPPAPGADRDPHFTALRRYALVPRAGHLLPREAPETVVDALKSLLHAS
jgi:pimeloyl-ACP methyl ester carboxylesterase